jgi:hypothetical protein
MGNEALVSTQGETPRSEMAGSLHSASDPKMSDARSAECDSTDSSITGSTRGEETQLCWGPLGAPTLALENGLPIPNFINSRFRGGSTAIGRAFPTKDLSEALRGDSVAREALSLALTTL